MIGVRVRLNKAFPLKPESNRMGVVVAENEDCLGVRMDDSDVPVLVRKSFVSVVLT